MSRKFKIHMDEILMDRTLMVETHMMKSTTKKCLQTIPINITEAGSRRFKNM